MTFGQSWIILCIEIWKNKPVQDKITKEGDILKKVEENKKRKQDALLNTAYHLFTQKGFQKTSISDIVKEAGVAKGTFYLYFKDKLDIRYKLIAFKSSEIFKNAYNRLNEERERIQEFEKQIIFLIDQVINELTKNPTLLKLISKHLGWGIFKNSLVEPIDDAQRNIYDIYMKLLSESGHEFREPEVMIYLIIELVAGSCYNSILMNQPMTIKELKPYLYESICLIIRNHQI